MRSKSSTPARDLAALGPAARAAALAGLPARLAGGDPAHAPAGVPTRALHRAWPGRPTTGRAGA